MLWTTQILKIKEFYYHIIGKGEKDHPNSYESIASVISSFDKILTILTDLTKSVILSPKDTTLDVTSTQLP